MGKTFRLIKLLPVIVSLMVCCNAQTFAQDTTTPYNGLALTPPMGWNSWNTFYCGISENSIKSVADSLVSRGLKDAGYNYIVIDDCWQIGRGADSVIIADSVNFPSGIKALADYIHSKGLKFGIYSDAGKKTCQGKPGSFNYKKIDAKTYAKWGVDYVKFDWCYTDNEIAPTQYTIMSKALLSTGRPIVFSICEWGQSSPWLWAQKVGNLWRATSDIQACWSCTQTWGGMGWTLIIDKVAGLSRYSGPGHWNDPDMLEVGNPGLSSIESQSHFSMWCMLAAPLMAGNDIRKMTAATKTILTNAEMIAVDQDSLGIQAKRIKNENSLEVWCKPLKDSSKAVAFFNRTATSASMSVKWNQLGFLDGDATVRDLWLHSDLGTLKDSFQVVVPSHAVVVIKVKGQIDNANSLALDKHSLTIIKGNSSSLIANRKPFFAETDGITSNSTKAVITSVGFNQYRVTGVDTGTCVVVVSSIDGKIKDTCKVTVIPSELPAPWTFGVIGATLGSAFFSNDTFSIVAGGTDIGSISDQCGYIKQSAGGNKSISCRLISQTETNISAKSGVMFRGSTSAGSPFVLLYANPDNKVVMEWRVTEGGPSYAKQLDTITYPVYLKLERINLSFIPFTSKDGITWKKVKDKTVTSFSSLYLIGMEAVSHDTQKSIESHFDNVEVQGSDPADSSLITNSTELQSNKSIEVTVYPNPTSSNTISVSLNSGEFDTKLEISIYSIDGKLVFSKSVKSFENKFDLKINSKLTNGIYHLIVKDSKNIGEAKFIVNKAE